MKKNRLGLALKLALLVSIPFFLFLARKQVAAVKLIQYSAAEREKIWKKNLPKATLEERLKWLEETIPSRIPDLDKVIEKGKTKIALVVYKKEREMELWLREPQYKKLKTYSMSSFSGKLGPKNRQGDYQIPEGVYRTSHLNPNSGYYLSIGINYPNENDRKRGLKNQIKDIGGDIFIHGRNVTIGCVPIGDHNIEEVFYIVGKAGLLNTQVVIAPSRLPLPTLTDLNLDEKDELIQEKYSELAAELTKFL